MDNIEFIAGGRRVINLFYGEDIHYRLEEIPAIEMIEVIDQISVFIEELYEMRHESGEIKTVIDKMMGENEEDVSPELIFRVFPILIKRANKQLSRFLTLLTKIPLAELNQMGGGLYSKIIENTVLLYWDPVTEMIDSFKSLKKKAKEWREGQSGEATAEAVREKQEKEPEPEKKAELI